MAAHGTTRRKVAMLGDAPDRTIDSVAVEEPLELRSGGRVLTITMRTPGHDLELAHGWLLAEGHIAGRDDVLEACFQRTEPADPTLGTQGYNVLELTLSGSLPEPRSVTVTSSACGACGSASLDALAAGGRYDLLADRTTVDSDVLLGLPGRLREQQRGFAGSGGLHAAGLFTPEGGPTAS